MKRNWKVLLSCLALTFTMGVLAACGETENSSSLGSSESVGTSESVSAPEESTAPESSAPESSAPESSAPESSAPEASTPEEPEEPTTYVVKFVDEDGTELSTETYEEGATVVEPTAPTKAADETYTYTFAGWDSEVTAASADVTYTATYTATYIDYTVQFVDEAGNVLETKTYHYGDTVEAPTPTKDADETYTYAFTGWDKEVTAVSGNATYTASFEATYIDYTVQFVDEDGSVLAEATYHYGDAVVEADAPTKAASYAYAYEFAGWDAEVATVTGDATYTATYTATLKDNLTAYKTESAQGEGIVLGAGAIGAGANYTQGQQVGGSIDQAYLAIDGNYGLDDYIALDFTGKNMPEIAFFAKNYNNSMYAEEQTKQGIVVASGITLYNGDVNTDTNILNGGKQVSFDNPFMIKNAVDGWFRKTTVSDSKLARANLVDDVKYRVIMGWTAGSTHGANGITLNWALYNVETGELLEEATSDTWNFFTGGNAQVNNMTLNDLVGSIVLYGKFGTTCTIDKLHGVYENTTVEALANGLNNGATSTVTFKDADGNVLQTNENVAFGATVEFEGELPAVPAGNKFTTYSYEWDKEIGAVYGDTVYTLKLVATAVEGYTMSNVTVNGDSIVLGAGNIGDGANYTKGQNNGGSVTQSYLALDGNYGFGNYVVFDFTGKNMPEMMFFAKNYDASMYYSEGKQGIVVASGITLWNGTIGSAQTNNTKVGVSGPFGAYYEGAAAPYGGNMLSDFAASLARANLVDGTQYRIIMGFENNGTTFTLNYVLYNVTDNTVVEQVSQTSWAFFTGSNEAVNNMTLEGLSGSIVLYGKFNTTCTVDKLYDVQSGSFDEVVANYAKAL